MGAIPNKQDNGQAIVEYALIIVGISLAALLALNLMGISIKDVYCTVAGALGSAACADQHICAFTFDNSSDLDGWVGYDVGRNLTIENGVLCNSGASWNFFDGCESNMDQSDFTANLSGIRLTNTGLPNPGFDFMFRMDAKGNGYWFTYNTAHDAFIFWKWVDGIRIPLSSAKVPDDWGTQELDIQIAADGDTFTASKDGQVILQAVDDTYTDGKFTWRNKPGSITCIDEISFE